MSKYMMNKEAARNEAIDLHNGFSDHNYSYGELAEYQQHIENIGRRYGLIREFRENGII